MNWQQLAYSIGRPLSPLYRLLMRARAAAYANAWLSRVKLDVPVISIGNLTMGGSGKTPMVMVVARILQKAGRHPAIISRGYGGKVKGEINLVSDGKNILLNPEDAGDEPLLLAESLPGVPVVTGPKRKLTGLYAVKELGADLIIMDDGFQHLALQRDLDLVLFKAPALLGDGRVFPGGYLREPISALARADAFIITGVDEQSEDKVEEFAGYLGDIFPARPVFKVGYRLSKAVGISGKEIDSLPLSDEYLAFCGLADPQGFRNSLELEGYNLAGFQSFPDHHAYTAADLEQLAAKAGGRALLTTEKDLVKLKNIAADLPVYGLPISLIFPPELEAFLLSFLEK